MQTGEVAGREEIINYTLPPSWSFSIWGLIYIGFLIYSILGFLPSYKKNSYFKKTGGLVALSILLNLGWTVTVGLDRWAAAFPMQVLMLVIAIILLFEWTGREEEIPNDQKWIAAPFALYAGWLAVALIPFAASLLNSSGWNFGPFSPVTWAIIMYGIAALIMLLAYRTIKHPFFLIPLVWAYAGFAFRFSGILRYTATSLAIIIILVILFSLSFFSRKNSFLQANTA